MLQTSELQFTQGHSKFLATASCLPLGEVLAKCSSKYENVSSVHELSKQIVD